MAPIIFHFKSCGHEDKEPAPQKLWKKLQERKALPGKLTVESRLPCPSCSRSYEQYYSDKSAWLHAACKNTNTDDSTDTLLLAELIWVRSSLEAQSDALVERATRLADSLPFQPRTAEKDGRLVVDGDYAQVRIVQGMGRAVEDVIGRVGALRELVARAETSPHHLLEHGAGEYEVPPRKVFGLFLYEGTYTMMEERGHNTPGK